MRILQEKGKVFLLGNEAIVRGALEAGVGFVSCFPGTPSSEIGDTFSCIAKDAGVYFEYSTNEKVALEAAIGASLSGVRSLVAMKHFGLNVASDSFLPSAYIEPRAGFVIIVADDPGCWSSVQEEEDTRYFARLANVPLIEPATPEEAKEFVKEAFIISEKFRTPVLFRETTRVAHTSEAVKLARINPPKTRGEFKKDYKKFYTFLPRIIEIHKEILEKLVRIANYFDRSKLNFIVNDKKNPLGVITSGVSYCYVMEALDKLGAEIPVLKIGASFPLPEALVTRFIKDKKSILIVEELEPILENDVCQLAQKKNINLKIQGKSLLPRAGELRPEIVSQALAKFLKKKPEVSFSSHGQKCAGIDIPRRFPVLCPGCPHRATFFAVKQAAPQAIFGGDIGCYMLGAFPPYHTQDFMYDMGASLGINHGIRIVTGQKVISFIGDSTFFHAGIPALINMVNNKSNFLIIVMDNRTTAMTGQQPHPGTTRTGMGEETIEIKVADIARAIGIKNVATIDAYDIGEMKKQVKNFLAKNEPSLIVARRACVLLELRAKRKRGEKIVPYEIDQKKCQKCGTCLRTFGCPAIKFEEGRYEIDKNMCVGCGVCAKICPFGAIKKHKT